MMRIITLFLSILFLLTSCQDKKKTRYTSPTDANETMTSQTKMNHPGKKLMENKCYLCHNPKEALKGRIAPPMVAVKAHYMNDDISKEDFANSIWNFVKKPNPNKSKMKGAVNRFGLMPYQEFKEADIRKIANYMYDYKIDEPEWFKEHLEEESKGKMKYQNSDKTEGSSAADNTEQTHTKFSEKKSNTEIGMEYALNTKKELGKNLMGTIQKKGTLAAVTFCNKQAYPITDSMAVAQNATIKRVSDKPRNPQNQANAKELGIIARFKKAIANKEDYTPVTEIVDGTIHFYAPITTNSMCLQCHGSPKNDIEPNVYKELKNLYSNDIAVDYSINELRGIWSITYQK